MLSLIVINKRKAVLKEKYKRYLLDGPPSKSKLFNSRNLFDDVNIVDRAIFYKSIDIIARQQYA